MSDSPSTSKRASAFLSHLLPSRSRSKSPGSKKSGAADKKADEASVATATKDSAIVASSKEAAPTEAAEPTTSSSAPKELLDGSPQAPTKGRFIRTLIMGGGSRGHSYAKAIATYNQHAADSAKYIPAVVTAVAEVDAFKRKEFGESLIWGREREPRSGEAFSHWMDWVEWERGRRQRVAIAKAEGTEISKEDEECAVDAVFVCVLDEMHVAVIEGVKALGGVHIMCEKPLATSLDGCVRVWKAAQEEKARGDGDKIFGICHVLRYSPHNGLLRELVREKEVVGEVVSVEHTEPVGWWHFSHSYVRGNWRKESKTAPSLLTKSCHDIDWLLWMLCSPSKATENEPPHMPAYISSTGSLKYFRKARKPAAAGGATNCLSCPIEKDCIVSAKKIYVERHLEKGDTGWPVKIVNPEIEECHHTQGSKKAVETLLKNLEEDYTMDTPVNEVEARPWFGRCAWECDNDVCDDQYVTVTWEDDPLPSVAEGADPLKGRVAKSASLHMIAFTESICERRGRIYGTKGEISYDSTNIWVHDFATGKTEKHSPEIVGGGHGGGDSGLARQFIRSVDAVINHGEGAEVAQKKHLGCTLEEVIRSHALVFAAEDARLERKVVDWATWWEEKVAGQLKQEKANGAASNGVAH